MAGLFSSTHKAATGISLDHQEEVIRIFRHYTGAVAITADARTPLSTLGGRDGSGTAANGADTPLGGTSRFINGGVPASAFEQVGPACQQTQM